jgi:hypothetical protein
MRLANQKGDARGLYAGYSLLSASIYAISAPDQHSVVDQREKNP